MNLQKRDCPITIKLVPYCSGWEDVSIKIQGIVIGIRKARMSDCVRYGSTGARKVSRMQEGI